MLWRDRAFLVREYVVDGKTCNTIALGIGCDWSTVLKWLKKFEIPLRVPGHRKGVPAANRIGFFRFCSVCGKRFWVIPSRVSKPLNACSVECKSLFYQHDRHWCWKGGTQRYMGLEWSSVSKSVRDSYDGKCCLCGRIVGAVHHLIPYRSLKRNIRSCLLPLCSSHHRKIESAMMRVFPEFYEEEGEFSGRLNAFSKGLRRVILSQATLG